jgi:metal transporter CNNM
MSEDCEFFSPSCSPASFWLYLIASLVLVSTAGMMAGLTMGLVSVDMLNVRILEMEGSDVEKKQAKRILPIVSRHHFLLVTLLLMNAIANEALPIFLDKIVPEGVAIILSVTCVLLFGEIIPSAIFTGPNQLRIAAALTPFVRVLMMVTSPISYPISKVLDWWIGDDHDPAQYKRNELKALVALQRETEAVRQSFIERIEQDQDSQGHRSSTRSRSSTSSRSAAGPSVLMSPLTAKKQPLLTPRSRHHETSAHGTRLNVDEVTIIHGALDLSSKTVTEIMMPMDQVFMLDIDTELNHNVMADILASGYSRIPVFEDHKANIVGLLLVKKLIVLDPDDERPIRDLVLRKPILVGPAESCYAVLNEFQKGRSHIAFVTEDTRLVANCWDSGVPIPPSVVFQGILTIEDVIEELIQEEIEDESDVYVHDIVDYWQEKSQRARVRAIAHKTFIRNRLKVLAERARSRVRSRKQSLELQQSGGNDGNDASDTIQIHVVSEPDPEATTL